MTTKEALINYCLRIGDTSLILGQRMSEWCSNGPILEEDIAMTNIALDHIGQARTMLTYAGELEGKGRTEDDFAYKRHEREYYNSLLSERPNGHFGDTVARNFLQSAYFYHLYSALSSSKDNMIAAHAAKSLKEVTYHLRHSAEWVVRLGDGTEESKEKIQTSFDEIWEYTGDLFEMNEVDDVLIKEGIAINQTEIKAKWDKTVDEVLVRAKLQRPKDAYMHSGRLNAIHSEYLGHLLAEMQFLPRAYPDAKW
ncbi:MAG: 1,2-phenylacetyl-CoA epoxidase, subunit C [Flavobacteriales bacterium]|nr:phenylacetate-CoA oxygenase subunit PaaC [Flavobacteriales bacterium]MBV6485085.1 1,2-phenylacetyl-CoA epoxidase, subunit C [Flavobacteriales bacterium]